MEGMEGQESQNMDNEILVRVARMYYEHGLNQKEIADRVGLSRSRISRLLTKAKDAGIVQITIVDPFKQEHELSKQLIDEYGLKRAVVCPIPESGGKPLKWHLGQAAARLIKEVIRDGDTVGVCGGTTMLEVARALKPVKRENVSVVQLEGSLSGKGETLIHGNEIATLFARVFEATPYFLSVPAIVENRNLRDALTRDHNLAGILEIGKNANIAVFSVGTPGRSCILAQAGYVSPDEMDALLRKGAVGDICSRFFDKDGLICDYSLDDRTIGLNLQEFCHKESCLLVAGGLQKLHGIMGALRGRLANMLVTDEMTAKELMGLAGSQFP
jgi:deoxyribonucleoside regulator